MNQKMGRPAKPYTIKLRGLIYSAKLASWKTPKSTGCKRKSDFWR